MTTDPLPRALGARPERDIVAELLADLPEGFRRERLEAAYIPEWDTIIAAPNTSTTKSVTLSGLPRRLRVELAWMMWWTVQDGHCLEVSCWNRWARLLHWAFEHGEVLPESFTELSRSEWEQHWRQWFTQRRGRLPGPTLKEVARHVLGRPLTALAARENPGPWWLLDYWQPRCDPRIPQRPIEPNWDKRARWDGIATAWLRAAGKWWLGTQLESGAMSWSTVCRTVSYLAIFDRWLTRSGFDLWAAPAEQWVQAVKDFDAWSLVPANRSAPGRHPRSASAEQQRNMFSALHQFFEFLYDNKQQACSVLGDDRWASLIEAHHEAWLIPGRRKKNRPPRTSPARYMDRTAMAAITRNLHILGADRNQLFDVEVDGERCDVVGLDNPQVMRAVLLQTLTGRRMNEILLLRFNPLSPVDHLGSSEEGRSLTRLTYAQSKIDQAPNTILVDEEVVELIREQQQWLRDRYPELADDDFPYLFVALLGNRNAARPYSGHEYRRVLRLFAHTLRLRDGEGNLVECYRTHNFRHTRFTELAEMGLPVHVLQRYAGHTTPTMSMRYVADREEHQEQVFLAAQKVRADGRTFEFTPEIYDGMRLFDRADRMLPNGWCLLPPLQNCDKGNACLTCGEFVTDASHVANLRQQLTETEALIDRRQEQFQQRTGQSMPGDNIWLRERTTEVAALRTLIDKLSTPTCQPVRGGGTTATATAVPITLDTSRLRRTR